MSTVTIGTRDSSLALWQAEWVRSQLEKAYPSQHFELMPVKTKGDKVLDVPLAKIGDKGLFTKELEQALLGRDIDLAVHSLKDLPTLLPEGLMLAAFCPREEPRDVFLGKNGTKLEDLPPGSVIGTSSLRRKAQLQHMRPDLEFADLRGNLQTRWQKLQRSDLAGIVLAAAGVKRLGWEERITQVIPTQWVLPAVGQGCIAVEIAENRSEMARMLSILNDHETERAVLAERSLMRRLEGGCQVPIGALAEIRENRIVLKGMVASLDGKAMLCAEAQGFDPVQVGLEVAENLLAQGAQAILQAIR
ncbi:MAG: hydroxymethylbilane synthase [Desulfitobacteriaceae bacterium]|nr:hydroxymethylbilane synthase [Desulfitobacteriaceae bacterium]MDI6877835.1 hydroxymethylbilane synthase [Desulfitobacteriaceae bacterium]MDI6912764.1 hydroxymethylbilane synthase [Desulfitobacteriaceae bacterium]